MACAFTELVLDCADPRKLADFWAAALGGRVVHDQYGFLQVVQPAGGPLLTFIPVPEAKTVKNRLHIDVNPVGCSRDEEVQRLLGLGASQADVDQGYQAWVVLADPEGNEFCVLGRRL